MPVTARPLPKVSVSPVGNRLVITVPWDKADPLHSYLRGHGIGSTVCLDPAVGTAHLELWESADPLKLGALVEEWEGCRLASPRRKK
jgi:hypothetical protein